MVKKSFWCSMLVSVYINTVMKLYMSRPSLTLFHAKKRKVWSEVLSSLLLSLLWGKGQGSKAGLQHCSPRKMLINFEAILDNHLLQLFFFLLYKTFSSFGHFSWELKAQWIFESLETNDVKFYLWCLFIFFFDSAVLFWLKAEFCLLHICVHASLSLSFSLCAPEVSLLMQSCTGQSYFVTGIFLNSCLGNNWKLSLLEQHNGVIWYNNPFHLIFMFCCLNH